MISAVTAAATVVALAVSIVLGYVSLRLTLKDREQRRSAEREQRTRVFGYGEKQLRGVSVNVTNGTEYPVRNIGVDFFSYTSSPKPVVLDKGVQTVIPFLGPGAEEPLLFTYSKHRHLENMRGRIGVRLSFIDINGQAWIRRPDGKVLQQEELKDSPGYDLPADMYSYKGPHTAS